MTQEEKELLLKDLCARLPYNVVVNCTEEDDEKTNFNCFLAPDMIKDIKLETAYWIIKPYLRPMSSMTEEEKKKLKADTCPEGTGYFDEKYLICPMNHFGEYISYEFMSDILEWLNSHHFDYRGLILMGLALEAPEGMYNY